jgi:hypothetical protein
MLNDQHQGLRRCASREAVVLAIRQAWDVVAGIAQGVQLAATGQGDRIVEGPGLAFDRHGYRYQGMVMQNSRLNPNQSKRGRLGDLVQSAKARVLKARSLRGKRAQLSRHASSRSLSSKRTPTAEYDRIPRGANAAFFRIGACARNER